MASIGHEDMVWAIIHRDPSLSKDPIASHHKRLSRAHISEEFSVFSVFSHR